MSTTGVTAAPYYRPPERYAEISTSHTLENDDSFADVTGAGVTLTMPPNPLPGQYHYILASGGNVIVSGGANAIDPSGTSVPQGRALELVFSRSGAKWCPLGGGGGGPSLPDRSYQFDDGGTFGGSLVLMWAADGFGIEIANDIGTVATTGNVRISGGPVDGDGFSIKGRNTTDDTDVGLFGFGEQTDADLGVITYLSFGDNSSFDPDLNPDAIFAACQYFTAWAFTTITPTASFSGWSMHDFFVAGPIPGFDHRRIFKVDAYTNWVMACAVETSSPENYLSNGEGVGYIGHAIVEPDLTPRASGGITPWVPDTTFQLKYRKPSGDYVLVDHQQIAFAFSANADQVLNAAQSDADQVIVAAGTILAPRKITSLRPATVTRQVLVKNGNAQDITWAWATGTAVTVTAGKSAIIGSDGTNATLNLGPI